MHPRKFVRDSMVFAAGQYVYRVLLMARGIIAARLLGPASYGAWNAIQLVMDYGTLAQAGTFQGLDQSVPPRIVDGDPVALDGVKRAGLFNVLVLTSLYALGALVYFLNSSGNLVFFWGMRGVAVALACVVLTALGFYHLNLLRAHNNIPAVSGWYLIQGVVGAGLSLAFIPRFGAWALLGGWLVATLLALIVTQWHAREISPIVPRYSRECLTLLRVGVPMFLYSGSTFIARTLDRVIIFKYLGALELGYYSLAVTGVTLLLYLPESVSYVLYPELLKRYREAGDRVEGIRDRVERTYLTLSVLVPAMCGLAYLLSRDLMGGVLPKFMPGLNAVRIVCFGVGGLAFVGLSAIVLMTLRRQAYLIQASILGAVLGAALDLIAVRLGAGITGVAWATLIAYVINGMAMLWLAYLSLHGTWRRSPAMVARALGALALSFAIAWGLDRILPFADAPNWGQRLLHMLLAVATFLPLYALAGHPLGRGTGLRQMIAEFAPVWNRRTGPPEPPEP